MKLVIAVVQGSDAERVMDGLADAGFRATQISSAGGFLQESNVTFLIGVEKERVGEVARVVEGNTTARTKYVNPLMPFASVAGVGEDDAVRVGASVFVVNVRRFIRLTG